MQFIHLFKIVFVFIPFFTFADEILDQRLSLIPPTAEDYAPMLQTVDNLMSALRTNKIANAYFMYISKDFRNKTSLQQFTSFVKTNPALFNNKSINLTSIQINNNIAYYTGNIISKDGQIKSVSIQLKIEGSRWKILGIQIN
jgi:hypothetical protein